MARLRFADVQSRPTEFLDLTSLTPDEGHDPNFRSTCEMRGEPDLKTQRS